MAKEPIILPDKYYLDYFQYLLDFVEKHYQHILDKPEYLFYQEFRQLSEEAKCLYIRLSNRTGDFFRLEKINYPEIPDPKATALELLHLGFLDLNRSVDPAQFRLFTKAELVEKFKFLDPKQSKGQILQELSELDIAALKEDAEILEILKNEEVRFIKLLFFGNYEGQMTEFVIRDVGNIKLQALEEAHFKPWFDTREDAIGVMHLGQLKQMLSVFRQQELPVEELISQLPWNEWLRYPQSKKIADKLLLKIAAQYEREGDQEVALAYYQYTKKHPSRERQIRILEKQEKKEMALAVAQEALENPANATELTFAKDYLNRSGIRIDRSMTKRLKDAPSVALVKSNTRVEQAAIAHFEEQGWNAVHAENQLWKGAFGLVFWQEIFDTSQGTFHHPLQRQPSDLEDHSFFENRIDILQSRMNKLRTRKQILKHIATVFEEKEGTANRFVTWYGQLLPTLEELIMRVPLAGFKTVLLEMAKRMKENSTGFPDLFMWKEKAYQFYEIKSPNDHLSAQQLFWLDFLNQQKIKAEILRINYE